MNNQKLLVIIEPTKDGLWAYIPELQGCTSFGENFNEIKANIKEAIDLHITGMIEDGENVTEINNLKSDIVYKFDLSTFFSEFPITITGVAKKAGINRSLLNQYIDGKKKLSLNQTQKIQNAIRDIGNEISKVNFV